MAPGRIVASGTRGATTLRSREVLGIRGGSERGHVHTPGGRAMADEPSADTAARITDEGIARMRERIGVVAPRPAPFNLEATVDGFRHLCHGYGEDNPLYTDPAYGASSRWGTVIGP